MTTSLPEPASPAPAPEPSRAKERKPRPTLGAVLSALGLLLVEVILPVLAAGGTVWYLFSTFNLWALDRTLALVLFGIAVFLLALIVSVVIDTLLSVVYGSFRRQGVRFSSAPVARVIKLAIGGVILPIGLIVAANLVPIPSYGTGMELLIDLAKKPLALTPPGVVGTLAQNSQNTGTKILSIEVLQGIGSSDALNQLINLAVNDRSALSDAGTSLALSKAIAAYKADAKAPLINLFNSIDPAKAGASAGVNSQLYERYFSHSFDSLQTEIALDVPDPADRDAKLAQVQAAQAALKTALTGVEESIPAASSGDPRLDFVLRTFQAMDLSQEKDILAFTKTVAADARYSSQVRGDALLLVAKLGDKNDIDGLFSYLKGSDDLLQMRALQAIYQLQDKISKTVGK